MDLDSANLIEPSLDFGTCQPFEPLNTAWITTLHIFFTIAMEVVSIFLGFEVYNKTLSCDPVLFIILFIHSAYWLVSWMTNFFFKRIHLRTKRDGYFEFFQVADKYASKPHKIISLWNPVYMVFIGIYGVEGISPRPYCDKYFPLSLFNFVFILLTLECVLVIYYLSIYSLKVKDFNRRRPPRDIEYNCSWRLNEHFPTSELGLRERWELVENLLEKQADVIMHFLHSNKKLNQRILELTNQKETNTA
ncbi:unnamed protein product [Bemisia tabaci]|uniref:Transmembrane protein 192 n=1 Tax=Bemisia tabaci TaxID=7038 RepID=A0A9P0A2M6_BEMTA|nr:unnamed protein product [Bemisia tabaci]